jgi:hypothetical protein
MSAVWKLLVLIALLAMPFGMAAAPAAVHQSAAAGMPMGHCPDQHSGHQNKSAFAECTMACSAALPAAEPRAAQPLRIVCAPVQPAGALRLHGLHPETATPPPKDS